MDVSASALRELHRIHRQLADLNERLERGPKQIRARRTNVTRLEAELEQAKEQNKAARMAADRQQVDLKSGEAKIKDLRTKLNTCNTNKEYQALLDQIAAAEMANSVLADEILEGLEKVDELTVKIRAAEARRATAKEELAKTEKQVLEHEGALQADVARLEGELKVAEAALPAAFRTDYDRVVNSKGQDALAQVEDDCCGGCFQKLTSNQLNELHMSRAIFCRSCGRLIYLPEGREPNRGR